MPNKYCNLVGANRIKDEYTKINDGFAEVESDIGDKVDKVTGKQLSSEDYSSEEKTKLAGIAAGANNYTHPVVHPPSIITQDGSNRFVTDAEKSAWDAKQSALSGDTTGHYHASDRDRANHTGTQTANTISDFAPTVRSVVLSGLSMATDAVISATDTILSALGKLQKQISDHFANTSNPHGTTKAQVGLGNVDNTADSDKSVLSATKLTTARTINEVSFDGTADIIVTDSTKLPLTGGVLTGKLELPASKGNSAYLNIPIGGMVLPNFLKEGDIYRGSGGDLYHKRINGTNQVYLYDSSNCAGVTQADAEAGTGTSIKAWTPERIKQAILALAPSGGGSGDMRRSVYDWDADGRVNCADNANEAGLLFCSVNIHDFDEFWPYDKLPTLGHGGIAPIAADFSVLNPPISGGHSSYSGFITSTVVEDNCSMVIFASTGEIFYRVYSWDYDLGRYAWRNWIRLDQNGGSGGSEPIIINLGYDGSWYNQDWEDSIQLDDIPNGGMAVLLFDLENDYDDTRISQSGGGTYYLKRRDGDNIGSYNIFAGIPYVALKFNDAFYIQREFGVGEINSIAYRPNRFSTTLVSANWSGASAPYTLTLLNSTIRFHSEIKLVPGTSIAANQLDALQKANIIGGTQANGSIQLKAFGAKPIIDIPIQLIIGSEINAVN